MKTLIAITVAAVALLVSSVALAGDGHVAICHKGKTLSVDSHAVKGHLGHGDKRGACNSGGNPGGNSGGNPPGNTGGDIPVTAGTFSQVNRILACADRPVLRTADNTMGISVDLDLAVFQSGLYTGVKFTVARFYAGVGATCDKLGGAPNGKFENDYPVWVR